MLHATATELKSAKFMGTIKVRLRLNLLSMNLRPHAKETGFFDARFFRRARRHGPTAGETPAATLASGVFGASYLGRRSSDSLPVRLRQGYGGQGRKKLPALIPAFSPRRRGRRNLSCTRIPSADEIGFAYRVLISTL
jgi:hypothetical protein